MLRHNTHKINAFTLYISITINALCSPPPPPPKEHVINHFTDQIGAKYESISGKYSFTTNAADISYENILYIDREGILLNYNHIRGIEGLYLTSSTNSQVIKIHATGGPKSGIEIKSNIANNGNPVGVNITAAPGAHAEVIFSGDWGNSFTGDTTVTGNASLVLSSRYSRKTISGNRLNIMKGAAVYIDKNDQIADHARVSLISYEKASKLNFSAHIKEQLQETFRELFVEGKGAIDFGSGDRHSEHGRRLLYIDDLIIGDGSTLRIHGWRDKRDYILVRKNSVHLEDALKKIEFKGYDRNNIHLENYNNAYWVISATPESATYGSLLVASTVPLSLLRRRIKACLGRSPS